MMAVAPALLYALFVWWFATGLVLLLVLRRKRAVTASLVGAALLFPISLYLLVRSGASVGVAGAYVAFTAAILLWGTQEIAFLTGTITGPRPLPCPPGATGLPRLRCALGAILYHELALLVSGVAVLAVTWHAPNQTGALTFLVLWVMRISAKLNLFLGVPVLNDELMPAPILYMRSYFARRAANAFFPVSIGASTVALAAVVVVIASPLTSDAEQVGYTLVAALIGLAIVEHLFMLVPLPINRLWRWSTGNLLRRTPAPPSRARADEPAGPSEIERVAITSP